MVAVSEIKTAVLNFRRVDSEYTGIHFYGPHLTDMTLGSLDTILNPVVTDIQWCNAILKYDDFITMNFIKDHNQYFAVLYGENGTIIREMDMVCLICMVWINL